MKIASDKKLKIKSFTKIQEAKPSYLSTLANK
jgi:hypothetical protein